MSLKTLIDVLVITGVRVRAVRKAVCEKYRKVCEVFN